MYLKWVGGKTKLADQLLSKFPKEGQISGRYLEPFFGSGAMYFAYRQLLDSPENDLFGDNIFRASSYIFGDTNKHLVNCHRVVQEFPDDFKEWLRYFELCHEESPERFYKDERKLVTRDIELDIDSKAAARFIYINKSCFNGIWRVNKSGEFNVPWNQIETVNLSENKKLEQAHRLLQGCDINLCSYGDIVSRAKEGDFVYLDPPYEPLSESSSFTAYTEDDWTTEDLIHLRSLCNEMDSKGVLWMMSNSTAQKVYDIFDGYTIETVQAHRFVKALKDNEKREKIAETVVTNYRGTE